MRITSYSPYSRNRKPSPIGVCGLVLSARRTTSSTGLMTLHWRKVTRLGEAANQTMLVGMKSVETCLACQTVVQASGTTYLATSIWQSIGSTLQLSFARKSKLGDLRPKSQIE